MIAQIVDRSNTFEENMRLAGVNDALREALAERDAEIARLKTQLCEVLIDDRSALNLLTENTTLRTQLAECEKEVERLNQMLHQTSQGNAELIGEVIQEARKQAVRECIAIVDSYIGTDHICAEIAETFGLEG